MDTSGFCQVGRHGTLSLLKHQTVTVGDTEDSILTSFGIDDDELTFGSSTTCGVRLYYPDIDSLHCKIVFDQFKAFLAILGSSGVIVDGCRVFPHTSGEALGSIQQTIVPLNNDSIFEIHRKRFKFNYPPKGLRKALYATPARPPQRALRLSMIHSAQVFSPGPSNDPRENLRILQSPVKNPSSPLKNPSPLKSSILPKIEEEEIVLVHTNHPRVVEEEKDLIILEDVPVQLLSPASTRQTNQFPVILPQLQSQPELPCTPRRRSLGGTALHRAVLIRSAQRAVLKAEKEREEVQEELEVFGTVVSNDDEDESPEVGDVEMLDISDENEETDSDDEPEAQAPLWRKSLERIIPWSLGVSGEIENEGHQGDESDSPTTNGPEHEKEMFPIQPSCKALGNFMTPQPRHFLRTIDSNEDMRGAGAVSKAGRFSLGGQARRVIVEQPWKVHDLVIPPATPSKCDPHSLRPFDPPVPDTLRFEDPSITMPRAGTLMSGNSLPPITEEERMAIQERRRSAVKEFNSTPFWAGGVPGMSPAKGGLDPPNMLSPKKSTATVSPSKGFIYGSPTKTRRPETHIVESVDSKALFSKDEEDVNTSGLLDKIKETVNDMKRRRSIILGGGNVLGTPQVVNYLPEDVTTNAATPSVRVMSEQSSVRKVDFRKITPSKITSKHHQATPKISPKTIFTIDEECTDSPHQEEPFSLLRPGALEGRRQSVISTPVRKEQVVTVVPVLVPAAEHTAPGKSEELPKETVARGRTWALRSGTERNESCADIGIDDDGGDTKSKATKADNRKLPNARRQRSRTPQQFMSADAATDVSPDGVSQLVPRSAASGKVDSVPPKHTPEEIDNVKKPPARRVRKAPTAVRDTDEAKSTRVVPKRGRPKKNPVPIEKSQDEGDSRPAGKPTSKVRSSVRGKTLTNVEETDSEDDPLDSYEIGGVPPSSSTEDMTSDSVNGQSKSRSLASVTKSKAATRIKQEEALEDSILPVATTRVGRRAKANTATQMPDVTPAVKTATGKARGRPKTPATAPANSGASIAEEKENTVGSRSKAKATEKVVNPEAEEVPVTLRVSRSRTTRIAAKAVEEDDEQPQPTKQRATRVMRTRTKTG